MLGDASAGHEQGGGCGGDLRAVVRDREYHRYPFVVVRHDAVREFVKQRLVEQVLLALGDEGAG